MDKLLVINAHPMVEHASSVSLQVLDHFLTSYKKRNPDGPIERIDLYRDYIPAIDRTVLQTWEKIRGGIPLDEEERRVTSRMSEILAQFKEARKYVICMPLHNFNIPSKLKDYMDNILIPQETFKYTKSGSVGLLHRDGRRLLVIQASDGIYTNEDWYTEVEYSHKYLKSMFNFIGIANYQIIRAQGNAVLDRELVLKKAFREAETASEVFVETVSNKLARDII